MSVTISTIYAAILGLLFVPFTFYVGSYRVKHKILLLDGGDKELARRIRAQGNFIETVPLAVILIVLMELNGASATWLHTLGMVGTLGVYLAAAGWLLASSF